MALQPKQRNLVILIVGIIMAVTFIKGISNREAETYVLSGPDSPLDLEEVPEVLVKQETIIVHIEGQVISPGVYELSADQRVIDAVEAAGGLSEEADRSKVNLAKRIEDEERIYIPAIGEDTVEYEPTDSSSSNKKININKANQEELTALPGIGEALANRIINYRQQHGSFKNVEEIRNVSGIGEKKFEDLKDLIEVR